MLSLSKIGIYTCAAFEQSINIKPRMSVNLYLKKYLLSVKSDFIKSFHNCKNYKLKFIIKNNETFGKFLID